MRFYEVKNPPHLRTGFERRVGKEPSIKAGVYRGVTINAKIILGFALVLGDLLWAGCSMAAQSDVAKDDALQWGEMAGGFEMTAAVDETNGIIHCYIRNATTNEMDYSSFDIGYCEDIHLEIRGATNWIKFGNLPFLPGGFGYSSGCPYFGKRMPPGEMITGTYSRIRSHPWPVQTFAEYLKWTKGDTNEALLTEKLNQWYASRETLEAATGRNDTFAIDLFQWGEAASLALGDSVEARVSQLFRTNMYGGMITLYSPSFRLSRSLLRSCAKENYPLAVRHVAKKP